MKLILHCIIRSLKPKSSYGNDKLSNKFIKKMNDVVLNLITYIINKSMLLREVPKDMKLAKVIPIFKSGDRTLLTNYRPISLLPSISKMLEKVIQNKVIKFCEKESVISRNQFGLIPGSSIIDAVGKFITDLIIVENIRIKHCQFSWTCPRSLTLLIMKFY